MNYIKEHKEFVALVLLQFLTIVVDHSYFGSDAVFSPVDFWKALLKFVILIFIVCFTIRQTKSQEQKEKEQDGNIDHIQQNMITSKPLDKTLYHPQYSDDTVSENPNDSND